MADYVKVTLIIDKTKYNRLKDASVQMGYTVPMLLKLCLVNSWVWFITLLDDSGIDSKGLIDLWKL